MDDVDGSSGQKLAPDFDNSARGGMNGTDGYVRTVDSQSTTNFGSTTFVDFAISCDYLNYVTGYSGSGVNLRLRRHIVLPTGLDR